jgi:hypothetical protein
MQREIGFMVLLLLIMHKTKSTKREGKLTSKEERDEQGGIG